MGIQINGNTDTISAIDGALNVSGASLGSASASSLNISGIVTASGGFSGNVTGNVTGNVLGNITGNISASGVSTFSGGVVVSAGSTSSPSISPTGDSNTGIFFPSPDTVAIAEGGVEALRVDSNGNVTIGTNTPVNIGGGGVLSKGLQIKNFTISNYDGEPNTYLVSNGYYDNVNWRYIQSKASARYDIVNDHTWYTASSGTAGNTISYTERARITSTGNVQIANGNLVFSTAGTGIDFSATANSSGTMTSELLSDYEEGTWTPTILASTSTVSYSTQYGVYTKVGRIVYCSIAIRASSVTGGNTVGLSGLPFTASNTSDTTQRSTWRPSNGGHVAGLSDATGRFRINGSTMDGVKGDTTTTYMTCAQLTSSGSIEITGDFWYFTA